MIVQVYGLQHYKYHLPAVSDPVTIVQEPLNKYNPNSIAVFDWKGRKLGYICPEDSQRVIKAMWTDLFWGNIFINRVTEFLIELPFPKNPPPNN
jgi:hypothetical protein